MGGLRHNKMSINIFSANKSTSSLADESSRMRNLIEEKYCIKTYSVSEWKARSSCDDRLESRYLTAVLLEKPHDSRARGRAYSELKHNTSPLNSSRESAIAQMRKTFRPVRKETNPENHDNYLSQNIFRKTSIAG